MTSPFAPYKNHGVEIVEAKSGGEVLANCPWCRARSDSNKKGSKTFCIRADGELWDCKTCGKNGNLTKFFLEVVRHNQKNATITDLRRLSTDRGGIEVKTFKAWGIGFSAEGKYTYPAWVCGVNVSRPVPSDVRIYRIGKKPISTAGGKAGLITPVAGGECGITGTDTIWICEGEWDGMAWWQTLRSAGITDDVLAVPGAGTLPQKAIPWFQGKNVVTLYDNDGPGQAGQKRTWEKLFGIAKTLRRIKWPSGLADGYDIRDLWMEKKDNQDEVYAYVKKHLISTPYEGMAGSVGGTISSEPEQVAQDTIDINAKPVPPKHVLKQYQKWLKVERPEMLDVTFGAVFANRIDVDPLWMFIVGPPGCGKSELLMSLESAPLIHCSTGLTNHTLISGMNIGKTDPSLLPRIIGRTWVVKDFTTVLGLTQIARDEIFSVLRDAYDGKVERPFGNGVVRKYAGRFGIIAGVTGKIDSVTATNAVLGERFLRWRMRLRGRVLAGHDVIMQALDNISEETGMRNELREVAKTVLNRPVPAKEDYPIRPQWFKERVRALAEWVASMRGVVEREKWTGSTGVIAAKPSTEIATRLAKQLLILGIGIGIYRGLKELDESVYRIIAQVGRDTCPDRAEEIIRALYVLGGSATTEKVAEETRFPLETARWVLQDLNLLGVVKKMKGPRGVYALSESVMTILVRLKLYDEAKAWKWTEKREEN